MGGLDGFPLFGFGGIQVRSFKSKLPKSGL